MCLANIERRIPHTAESPTLLINSPCRLEVTQAFAEIAAIAFHDSQAVFNQPFVDRRVLMENCLPTLFNRCESIIIRKASRLPLMNEAREICLKIRVNLRFEDLRHLLKLLPADTTHI